MVRPRLVLSVLDLWSCRLVEEQNDRGATFWSSTHDHLRCDRTRGANRRRAPQGNAASAGEPRAFWRLLAHGAVLLMLTLGIYRFWLRHPGYSPFPMVEHRSGGRKLRIYRNGTRSLRLGFLIAIAYLLLLYAGFFLGYAQPWGTGTSSPALLVLTVLGHYAVYRRALSVSPAQSIAACASTRAMARAMPSAPGVPGGP